MFEQRAPQSDIFWRNSLRPIRCCCRCFSWRIRHLRIAAGVLGHEPVDLIVLAVPVISADPITETALALVRRLLALTPEAA
jgi:hypothetical protein